MPRNLLLIRFAAIPVVLLPVKGSKIQALGFVEAKISRARTDRGFCVKRTCDNAPIASNTSHENY